MSQTSTLRRRLAAIRKRYQQWRRRAWQVQPNDVYLVSYPRSGNTWMRYLLANLLEPEGTWNINNLSWVVPDIHEAWPANWIEREPRILKSHEAYRPDYRRAIYLYRDGRDVAVSYYDFMRKLHGYQGTFDVFFRDYLDGKLPYGSWHEHIVSWRHNAGAVELLSIKYETLLVDTQSELTRLGDFLQLSWSRDLIASAIAKSSMQKVRTDYRTLKHGSHWEKGFHGGVGGGPGKWKQVLTSEQAEQFWNLAGAIAGQLGYWRE